MNQMTLTRVLLPIVVAALAACSCMERVPEELPVEIPGVETLFEPEPMLTTSIADAPVGVPFLDGHDAKGAIIMTALPRTPDGGFILNHPGYYQFEAKSYCVSPGKHSPGSGEGFLLAPLKGPRADVVQAIVERSYKHPELEQTDVQSLLWGVISRTKISDMSPELQRTAGTLLTRQEIRRLNGGALGMIPDEILDRAISKLPAPAQEAFEAEARLRELLSDADTTYEELERVAVQLGEAPASEGDVDVPRGRWSFHPNGYFIRYLPDGFSRNCITIYVPAPCTIERDRQGRITAITGFCGRRLEVEYDDSIKPGTAPATGGMSAYAFRSIRFLAPDVPAKDGKPRTSVTEWKDTGWTLSGSATAEGRPKTVPERFAGLAERCAWSKQHKAECSRLAVGVHELVEGTSHGKAASIGAAELREIVELGNFALALREAFTDDQQHATAGHEAIALAERAWMAAVATELGASKPSRFLRKQQATSVHGAAALVARPSPASTLPHADSASGMTQSILIQSLIAQGAIATLGNDGPTFNPAGGAAAPGGMATQVLVSSASGTDVTACKAKAWKQLEKDVDDAFSTTPGSCDLQALAQCWKTYTQKRQCIVLHCQGLPDGMTYPEAYFKLFDDLAKALDKWAKADKGCEK